MPKRTDLHWMSTPLCHIGLDAGYNRQSSSAALRASPGVCPQALGLRRLGREDVPGHVNLFHALLADLSLGRVARQVWMPGLA